MPESWAFTGVPASIVGAKSIPFGTPCGHPSFHSLAPPLQNESASLGFVLAAASGRPSLAQSPFHSGRPAAIPHFIPLLLLSKTNPLRWVSFWRRPLAAPLWRKVHSIRDALRPSLSSALGAFGKILSKPLGLDIFCGIDFPPVGCAAGRTDPGPSFVTDHPLYVAAGGADSGGREIAVH